MDPSELASEPAPCYARRGRIEPPLILDQLSNLAYNNIGMIIEKIPHVEN